MPTVDDYRKSRNRKTDIADAMASAQSLLKELWPQISPASTPEDMAEEWLATPTEYAKQCARNAMLEEQCSNYWDLIQDSKQCTMFGSHESIIKQIKKIIKRADYGR